MDMIIKSGPVAKVVLLLLLLFSVISWAIIFFKFIAFKKIRSETNDFTAIFTKRNSLEAIYAACKSIRGCPMVKVFFAGYREFESEFRVAGSDMANESDRFFLDKIDGVSRSMERATMQEITKMERFLFFLATTGSTGPFIGLFGTVWGIMKSFQDIGLTGSSNIAIVAPGIAEALIATAAGLLAAIPAVIGYNYFIARVKVFATEMDNFALDFLSIIEKNFVKK